MSRRECNTPKDERSRQAIADWIDTMIRTRSGPPDLGLAMAMSEAEWRRIIASLRIADAAVKAAALPMAHIGEVLRHEKLGRALVQWTDNGLRPVGMKLYAASPSSIATPLTECVDIVDQMVSRPASAATAEYWRELARGLLIRAKRAEAALSKAVQSKRLP